MRKIQVLGLALVALFAFGAFSAVSASAFEIPCIKGNTGDAANYLTEAECLKMEKVGLEGEWYLEPQPLLDGNPIPAGELVEVNSTLSAVLLEDMGTKVQVLAEGVQLGTMDSEGKSEVTKFEVQSASYERAELCEGTPVVEAINLPYKVDFLLANAEFWIDLLNGGKGTPGWLVECKTFVGTFDDVCTSEEGGVLVENDGEGGLNAFFNEETVATCSGAPGSKEGLISSEGAALLFNPAGLTVALSEE